MENVIGKNNKDHNNIVGCLTSEENSRDLI